MDVDAVQQVLTVQVQTGSSGLADASCRRLRNETVRSLRGGGTIERRERCLREVT